MDGISGIFPYATISHAVSGAGFVLTTWLAAYLTVHVSRSSSSRIAIISLFTLSGYFLHTVLCVFVPAHEIGHIWRRYLGWIALFPIPIWMHLSTTLLPLNQQKKWRLRIGSAYMIAGLMSVLWVLGPWEFSRYSILPPGWEAPTSIFTLAVGTLAFRNIYILQKNAADRTLQTRYTLLSTVVILLITWIIYWPLVDLLNIPWEPTTRIAIGDGIPLAAALVLSYAVAFHNIFMAGRWVKRDFFFHAASIGGIACLYLITVIGAEEFALAFNLDVATLTFISVVGLTLLTHWLAEPLRRYLDNIFFKQLNNVTGEMVGLTQDLGIGSGILEAQMNTMVNRLKELTGASVVCIAVRDQDELLIKASTESERIGKIIPSTLDSSNPVPRLKINDKQTSTDQWDCLVLSEPIMVNKEVTGYLLLGERGVGEGYDREERVWISTLAAYLGVALEQAGRREETARRFSELTNEVETLAKQEISLQREFEAALAGPTYRIDQQELREALYAYNYPERLHAILTREGNTLVPLVSGQTSPVPALQQKITQAVDSIAPPDLLPSLDSLQNRNTDTERKRHLPTAIANYYTLRLVMAGHTHESIAEILEVSSRQVRNYLERAVISIKVVLENENGVS